MHHSSFFVGRQYYIPYHIPGDVRSSFCICWWYCSRVIFYLLEDCITPQFSSIISHLIFVTPERLLHTPCFIPGEIVWHLIFVSPSKLLQTATLIPGEIVSHLICVSPEKDYIALHLYPWVDFITPHLCPPPPPLEILYHALFLLPCSSSRLRTLMRGLSPAYLRFGGTSADYSVFTEISPSKLEHTGTQPKQAAMSRMWSI